MKEERVKGEGFREYLIQWASSPSHLTNPLTDLRELGVSEMDNTKFRREVVVPTAVDTIYSVEIQKWFKYNWYMSNGFTHLEYAQDQVLFDRVVFDFDLEENPGKAVEAAVAFATRLYEKYGAVPLVAKTGFKGAAVYVFYSREVDWATQEFLFKVLSLLSPDPKLIDSNMNQWNRVARIPLTYNLKKGEKRKVIIIHPEKVEDFTSFSWSLVKVLDIEKIRVERPQLPQLPQTTVVAPARRKRIRWIEKLIETGVPDGRHRAIGLIIMPYLANYLGLPDEEVLERCKIFIENSCKNFNNCKKVYDSWLRSMLRTVRSRGYRVISREKLAKEHPDLLEILYSILQVAI